MDGTLIDSTDGITGAWETFAQTYAGIDIVHILKSSFGVRTVENLRKYCGITDPGKLEEEAIRFEQAIIDTSRITERKGITILPGVRPIMDELLPAKSSPNQRWGICTSAARVYATFALEAAGIALPEVFVTADDVKEGKPSPDPYLLGSSKCGFEPWECLVIEDAPAGVRSGLSAGYKVIGLLTTHSRQEMEKTHPDFLVPDLTSVKMKLCQDSIDISVHLE
ncbi:HAD-like domain-containing protein [Scleroderma yunnanense]